MGWITKTKRDFLAATFRPAVVSTQKHTESDHTVVYVGVCMCVTSPEHEIDGNLA